jgi:putative ABC transport system permease protein
MEAAAEEVGAILHQIRGESQAESQPYPGPPRFEIVTIQDQLVAPVRPALRVLVVAVGIVLLIACANVASLLLARTSARQREIAVRAALGAGRDRLVRQMLTESVLLALLGGVAGTALAFAGIGALRNLGVSLAQRSDLGPSASFPRLEEIGLDATTFAFTIAAALFTGVLFGLAPAVRFTRRDLMDVLRDGGASTSSGFRLVRASATRSVLVVAETTMAMMLLVGGGLLIHSFLKLTHVNTGFDPANVLTFQVRWSSERDSVSELKMLAEGLVGRVRAVPGVRVAAYAHQLPMVQMEQKAGMRIRLGEQLPPPPGPNEVSPYFPDLRLVSQEYLKVIGTRVTAGRAFGENDQLGRPLVMLINEALARSRFPGESPLRKHVYVLGDHAWEIVGVVEDVRQKSLDQEPTPQIFVDFRQWPRSVAPFDLPQYYVVRLVDDRPSSVIPTIRGIVRTLDEQASLDNVAMMEQLVSTSVSRQRMYAVLLGIFAAVAAALAAIGIYGVMTFSVAQRTREIGIRMALGAHSLQVIRLVLRQSMVLTVLGIALGLAGAAAVTRYLEGLLFGLTPLDPMTFIIVSVVFASVAAFASYLPARRATKVDPLIALRCE